MYFFVYVFFGIILCVKNKVSASCGGNYTNDFGGSFTISILDNKANPDNCLIRISVSEGKLAVVRFKNIKMAVTTDCTEDYVEIRDGSTLESPLIRRYCSSNIFSVAGRTNHLLLRVLNTGTSPPYLSFTAEYFAYDLENARLNSTVGTYSSPRYQGTASLGYPNNLDFTITIESPAETGLILVFTEFILQEKSGTKCFDFIEVSEPDGTILGTFCGATPPQDIVTRYNTVYIRFKTNPVTTFAGFTVTWETCGDHFTQSNGIMTIPTRQSYYRNNMNCHYLFTEPPGKKVVLTFTEIIRIEDIVNGHCVDYIQLFEGGHESKDTIYLGCATINPFSIASRGNEMLLKFVSDTRVTNTGFTLSYKAVDICRYKYDTMGGTIQSPNYNGQYSANEHCEFEIETTPLSQILVHYEKFLLESKDPECHDYLQIVDPMAPTVKTQSYCARNTPPSGPYTGHELRMKFVSDDRIQYDGFVAYWAACGGLHREHQGMIKAPYNYVITGWSQTCVHTIMPDQFDKIYLMMKVTSTLQGTCTESVQLTEEVNGANSTVWNFPCTTSDDGDGFVRKLFQGTRMFLKFNMPEGRRHKVDYEFSWTACGARITSRTGTIHSPFYPGYYPIQQTCAYIIDAASGSNVILDFTELDLVQGEDCEDSIKVYDGINSNGRLLQYIRGSTIPASIVSSSSRMYITFNPTCNHVSGKGFLAKWQVCGSVTNEEDGELLTPRYPQTYLRNIRCMTTITTTPGKIVNLMFEDFSVGSDIGGQCINDYVEISDGFVLQSTLIGRYCGARTTFMINSTSNTLNVLLVSTSDRNLGFRGYKAKYHSLIKGELTTTTPIPDNTTIVYSYIQDPDYFSDTSIIVTVVLVLIAVLLIVAVVTLYIFLRRKKPPLIIPEQKIVVPPSPGKPNDEILNFRENTQLIDIYKGINSKSPTLQEQLRDRRRSTSFLPRDIYSQPHRHRKESIPEMESELAAPPMTEKPDVETKMPNITVYDADDYAKVNKRQEKVSEDFGTFGKKRGYNNQAYTEGNLQIRESKDMMYL